jgi:hypothetical protein
MDVDGAAEGERVAALVAEELVRGARRRSPSLAAVGVVVCGVVRW